MLIHEAVKSTTPIVEAPQAPLVEAESPAEEEEVVPKTQKTKKIKKDGSIEDDEK